VQAFRRPDCPVESIRVKLRGIKADAVYVLKNSDVPGTMEVAGCELWDKGLLIPIKDQLGSAIISYQKKPQKITFRKRKMSCSDP
jgi:hypothetical protein